MVRCKLHMVGGQSMFLFFAASACTGGIAGSKSSSPVGSLGPTTLQIGTVYLVSALWRAGYAVHEHAG